MTPNQMFPVSPLGQAIAFRELRHRFTSIDDDENFTFIAG
jgi:hypothetical protein